jgi:hypothetical protein
MKGRIRGFSYDSKEPIAHFSLYVPKTAAKASMSVFDPRRQRRRPQR